jgi:hypothetical protein
MKRILSGTLTAAALALLAQGASAQANIFASAGASLPIGEFGDYANTGWMAQAGVGFQVAPSVSAGAGGFYGSNSHTTDGDKTNLYGALAYALFTMGEDGSIQPYVFGGPGFMVHSYKSESFPGAEGSESALAAGAGAGVNLPLGSLEAFIEGMVLSGFSDLEDTRVVVLAAGVSFPLGG